MCERGWVREGEKWTLLEARKQGCTSPCVTDMCNLGPWALAGQAGPLGRSAGAVAALGPEERCFTLSQFIP